jgi:hypothetical protein
MKPASLLERWPTLAMLAEIKAEGSRMRSPCSMHGPSDAGLLELHKRLRDACRNICEIVDVIVSTHADEHHGAAGVSQWTITRRCTIQYRGDRSDTIQSIGVPNNCSTIWGTSYGKNVCFFRGVLGCSM